MGFDRERKRAARRRRVEAERAGAIAPCREILAECQLCRRRPVREWGMLCPQCVLARWRELDRAMRMHLPESAMECEKVETVQEYATQKRVLILRTDKRWHREFYRLMKDNPGVPDNLWAEVTRGWRDRPDSSA